MPEKPAVRVSLLGGYQIQRDEQVLPLSSRNAQLLFAYLLLHRGPRRREQIAGTLWPDLPEDKGRERLRYALWELRQALGEGVVQANKVEVGVAESLAVMVDAAPLLSKPDPDVSLAMLQDQVAAYQGELLPGVYDDWASRLRRRAQTSFETKAYRLVWMLTEAARWTEARAWAETWIEFGETPEPAYRALILACGHLGDGAGAAAAFQRCVDQLRADLDVEPAVETQTLLQSVQMGDLPDRFDATPAVDVGVPATESKPPVFMASGAAVAANEPFVARESQMASLAEQLAAAAAGRGRAVFVTAQAGGGKTSLLRRFAHQAAELQNGLLVLFGRAEAHSGSGQPYLPFRQMLGQLIGDAEAGWRAGDLPAGAARELWAFAPSSIQALADAGPDLAGTFLAAEVLRRRMEDHPGVEGSVRDWLSTRLDRVGESGVPVNIDHGNVRSRLLEQAVEVFARVAEARPLLLLLDDMQWSDQGTLDLLFMLGRRIEAAPVLIVSAFRPEALAAGAQSAPLAQVVTELERVYGLSTIDLDAVDDSGRRALIDGVLDSEPNLLDDSFRRQLLARTEGLPLFAVELLRQLQAEGWLRQDDQGRWQATEELPWNSVPARVEAVIDGRLNRLRPGLRELLEAAAVEGETFTAEVLAEVTGRPAFAVVSELSRDLDQGHQLVKADGPVQFGDRRASIYRFRHVLFQEHLYAGLDAVRKAYLHESVGGALESLHAAAPSAVAPALARHFEACGKLDEAVEYGIEAGRNAKGLSAHPEAIAQLTEVLWWLRRMPNSAFRQRRELELRVVLGASLVASKGYASPKVARNYERAHRLAEALGESEQLAPVLWGVWTYYIARGDMRRTLEVCRVIEGQAADAGEPALQLVADWALGVTLAFRSEIAPATAHLKAALAALETGEFEALRRLFGQDPEITCRVYYAFCLSRAGQFKLAAAELTKTLDKAAELKHGFSTAFAHAMAAAYYFDRAQLERTLSHAGLALRLSTEGDYPYLRGLAGVMAAWAGALSGKVEDAGEKIERGVLGLKKHGGGIAQTFMQMMLADVQRYDGDIDGALDTIEATLELAEARAEYMSKIDLMRLRAEALADRAEAASDVESAFLQARALSQSTGELLNELRTVVAWGERMPESRAARKAVAEIVEALDADEEMPLLAAARSLADQG